MSSESNEVKNIVIISDGTGTTARRLMDAVLIQYYEKDIEFSLVEVFQKVRDKKSVNRVLKKIKNDYLVLFSIISQDLAVYLSDKLDRRGVLNLNVLQPMLDITSKFLGVHPDYMPGKLHIVNDSYYKKIDAIGYAVDHDDGRGAALDKADVVLLGVSRTCKTPVSMYLACNHGMNVANIPIVLDSSWIDRVLGRIQSLDQHKIVGLLMQPDTLAIVREHRSRILVNSADQLGELMDYYDIRKVTKEYRFSEELFNTFKWKVIDVTRRAIEEISLDIISYLDSGNK